jgi:hypothetical protein
VFVRPEFGPTLPELLAARGLSRRAIAAGAVALVVLAAGAWLLVQSLRDREHLVADGPPAFNLVYAPSVLHRAPARGDELVRLEGARRDVSVTITVRPVRVPAHARADVVGGYLPILAERRLHELRRIYGPVGVADEGKSRSSRLPGYQIGFSAKAPQGTLYARDSYVFPDDPKATEGALLSLRRVVRRRQTAADDDFFATVRAAYVSFAFGKSQP